MCYLSNNYLLENIYVQNLLAGALKQPCKISIKFANAETLTKVCQLNAMFDSSMQKKSM